MTNPRANRRPSTRVAGLVTVLLLLAGGCATTKNYGAGNCTEYVPMCMTGDVICDRDQRGCEVCTCLNDAGAAAPPPMMPPR